MAASKPSRTQKVDRRPTSLIPKSLIRAILDPDPNTDALLALGQLLPLLERIVTDPPKTPTPAAYAQLGSLVIALAEEWVAALDRAIPPRRGRPPSNKAKGGGFLFPLVPAAKKRPGAKARTTADTMRAFVEAVDETKRRLGIATDAGAMRAIVLAEGKRANEATLRDEVAKRCQKLSRYRRCLQ